jgi:phage terminase large subunit
LGKSKKKTRRRRADGRDWRELASRWAQSGLSLAEFCRREKIPLRTAQMHIKTSDRDKYLSDVDTTPADNVKDLTEGADRYGTACEKSYEALAKIAVDTTVAFKRAALAGDRRSLLGLSRASKEAWNELRTIAREMELRPTGEDLTVEWPVTRGFWPLPSQRNFLFDLPSTTGGKRIFAYIGGIGAGKTRTGAEKFGKLCELNRGCNLGVFAPTYRMLQDVTKQMFLDVCQTKGVPCEHHKTDNAVILWGDTTVYFRSMSDPDKIRGLNLGAAWLDEVAQLKKDEAFKVIQGRVRNKNARERCAIITTTPNGFNWLYDALVKNAEQNQVIEYKAWTEENAAHLPDDFIEQVKRVYDAKYAEQELHAEWINIYTGRAYYNFSRKKQVVAAARVNHLYDRSRPLILMCDFNVEPMGWLVGQSFRLPKSGQEVTYIQDELYINTTNTEETAREFISRWGKHPAGVRVYGDAAGRHRHTSATKTDYAIIEEVLKNAKMPNIQIRVGKSNPLHEERVKDVNARLLDSKGVIHLYISDKCQNLIEDMEKVGFKAGTRQLDKSDIMVGHLSDGLGYYINREHAVRRMKITHGGR